MSVYTRRFGPLGVLWVAFLVLTINYFTGELSGITSTITTWGTIVANFLLILATATFLLRSMGRLRKSIREKKVGEELLLEVYTLVVFAAIIITYFVVTLNSPEFAWIEKYLYLPGEAVAYGFCPIYIGAAVYRTWRVRGSETALLIICFILTLIKGAPVFGAIPWTQQVGIWLTTYLEKGPFRVLQIGAGIGILVTVLRGLRGRLAGYE